MSQYCMDCKFWGKEWVKDLMRECQLPPLIGQEKQVTAIMYSCIHWMEK